MGAATALKFGKAPITICQGNYFIGGNVANEIIIVSVVVMRVIIVVVGRVLGRNVKLE